MNSAAGSTSPHNNTAVTDSIMDNHGGIMESMNIGIVSAAITLNTEQVNILHVVNNLFI